MELGCAHLVTKQRLQLHSVLSYIITNIQELFGRVSSHLLPHVEIYILIHLWVFLNPHKLWADTLSSELFTFPGTTEHSLSLQISDHFPQPMYHCVLNSNKYTHFKNSGGHNHILKLMATDRTSGHSPCCTGSNSLRWNRLLLWSDEVQVLALIK